MTEFKVLRWGVGSKDLGTYDIIPYFTALLDKNPEAYKDKDSLKKFILSEARYMFWGRCEWEILVSPWPESKKNEKIDVYYQIEMNINVIVDLIWNDKFKTQSSK